MSRTFFLDAESLVSKWGFGDGDALDDWWWETFDEEPTFDTDDLLFALVVDYLVPAMRARGLNPTLVRIGTNHNPVRVEYLNGNEVDWYSGDGDMFEPPIFVAVTREQVVQMARAIVIEPGAPS